MARIDGGIQAFDATMVYICCVWRFDRGRDMSGGDARTELLM
ncbi:hypothetical protein [Polymorphobacter sp. PAMC 29334]|nr:hypothetical protein [Polymorphobacter sp. PAMC 29334]